MSAVDTAPMANHRVNPQHCDRRTYMVTSVRKDAVLIVKIPKTEEYKALQPKKVEIT